MLPPIPKITGDYFQDAFDKPGTQVPLTFFAYLRERGINPDEIPREALWSIAMMMETAIYSQYCQALVAEAKKQSEAGTEGNLQGLRNKLQAQLEEVDAVLQERWDASKTSG